MSYIVREVTIRKAEELLRDLLANVDHMKWSKDFYEIQSDDVLATNLKFWLQREKEQKEQHETKVAEQDREQTD